MCYFEVSSDEKISVKEFEGILGGSDWWYKRSFVHYINDPEGVSREDECTIWNHYFKGERLFNENIEWVDIYNLD